MSNGSILAEINTFLEESGMPWTKFGRLSCGDPRLVGDLRNGRELRPNTASRVRAFMQQHQA